MFWTLLVFSRILVRWFLFGRWILVFLWISFILYDRSVLFGHWILDGVSIILISQTYNPQPPTAREEVPILTVAGFTVGFVELRIVDWDCPFIFWMNDKLPYFERYFRTKSRLYQYQ
jgi:hypothetical protein